MLHGTCSILVPGVSFSFHAAGAREWREAGVGRVALHDGQGLLWCKPIISFNVSWIRSVRLEKNLHFSFVFKQIVNFSVVGTVAISGPFRQSIRKQYLNIKKNIFNIKPILSRHHCPRDPMRLPSACATSVPFRARYQFSRGFFSPGRKRLYLEVSWRFFRFKSFKIVTRKYQKTCLCPVSYTHLTLPTKRIV